MPSSPLPEQENTISGLENLIEGSPSSLEPTPIEPVKNWEHFGLYQAVYKALFALPDYFETDLFISGVRATDLFTFNTSLGATIEDQVVASLNQMRSVWDPDQQYALYHFVRQAQRFPDVILRASAPDLQPAILMGVELKGWYVLSKESEPSFRYKVTPAVCSPADLLVIFPWAFSNVISGSPKLFQPFVTSARYAAAYRNWHWQSVRKARGVTGVTLSGATGYYPTRGDMISDVPRSDSGGNFGRFARTGLMDSYISEISREELAGIPIRAWQRFLKLFSEEQTEEVIYRELERMATEQATHRTMLSEEAGERIKELLAEIVNLLGRE